MQKLKFNTRFIPPPSKAVAFTKPTMTQQHFKDECDINLILKRHAQTGILPQALGAIFADVSEYGDYREMLHKVMEVDAAFATLPSTTRAFFQNDPSLAFEFISNPANLQEAQELGLLPKSNVPGTQTPAASLAAATSPQGGVQPAPEGSLPLEKDAGASS